MIQPGRTIVAADDYTFNVFRESDNCLLTVLAEYEDGLERARLLALMGLENDSPLPQQLVDRGLLLRTDVAAQNGSDATVRMVRLTIPPESAEDALKECACTAKQAAVVRLLCEAGEASVKETCYFAGVTTAVLQALVKKELAQVYEREVLRSPHTNGGERPPISSAVLNDEQQAVYDGLFSQYRRNEGGAALLFGVTGSGKTQVYMNLIDRVLEDGKQYRIDLVQAVTEVYPPSVDLTLARIEQKFEVPE